MAHALVPLDPPVDAAGVPLPVPMLSAGGIDVQNDSIDGLRGKASTLPRDSTDVALAARAVEQLQLATLRDGTDVVIQHINPRKLLGLETRRQYQGEESPHAIGGTEGPTHPPIVRSPLLPLRRHWRGSGVWNPKSTDLNAGSQCPAASYVSSGGGDVLRHPKLYLVFLGRSWGDYPEAATTIRPFVSLAEAIASGPYMNGMAQYGVGRTHVAYSFVVNYVSPPTVDTDKLYDFVGDLIDMGSLPETGESGHLTDALMCMILAPEIADVPGRQGAHSSIYDYDAVSDYSRQALLYTTFTPGITWDVTGLPTKAMFDDFSNDFSHELAEACTNPFGDGYYMWIYDPLLHMNRKVLKVDDPCAANEGDEWEIADACEQASTGTIAGISVVSYFSGEDGHCIVPVAQQLTPGSICVVYVAAGGGHELSFCSIEDLLKKGPSCKPDGGNRLLQLTRIAPALTLLKSVLWVAFSSYDPSDDGLGPLALGDPLDEGGGPLDPLGGEGMHVAHDIMVTTCSDDGTGWNDAERPITYSRIASKFGPGLTTITEHYPGFGTYTHAYLAYVADEVEQTIMLAFTDGLAVAHPEFAWIDPFIIPGSSSAAAPALVGYRGELIVATVSLDNSRQLVLYSSPTPSWTAYSSPTSPALPLVGQGWREIYHGPESTKVTPGLTVYRGQLYIAFLANTPAAAKRDGSLTDPSEIMIIYDEDPSLFAISRPFGTGFRSRYSPSIQGYVDTLLVLIFADADDGDKLKISTSADLTYWTPAIPIGQTSDTSASTAIYVT